MEVDASLRGYGSQQQDTYGLRQSLHRHRIVSHRTIRLGVEDEPRGSALGPLAGLATVVHKKVKFTSAKGNC
jgi:hypothetical protein